MAFKSVSDVERYDPSKSCDRCGRHEGDYLNDESGANKYFTGPSSVPKGTIIDMESEGYELIALIEMDLCQECNAEFYNACLKD